MDKLRLRFEKTGRAVYISHLDLMRTVQRAFLRAGLPLKYSEGFNPHPQISILLPLPVGCASVCELMDFRLQEGIDVRTVTESLKPALPEGILPLEAYSGGEKAKELKWLEIEGSLCYDSGNALEAADRLTAFFSRPSIIIRKKTKRCEGESDIVPAIQRVSFHPEGTERVTLSAVLSAQEPTLSPSHLIEALAQLCPEWAPDFFAFTRLETFKEDMSVFR